MKLPDFEPVDWALDQQVDSDPLVIDATTLLELTEPATLALAAADTTAVVSFAGNLAYGPAGVLTWNWMACWTA